MSLFVQGAKRPTVEGDKSIKAEIRCIGGKWEFGIMTGGYYCSQEWTFYPLSELPPHGRLIDADALIRELEITEEDDHNGATLLMAVFLEVLKSAPTIIPASEEGE